MKSIYRSRPVFWDEESHGEEELCVCPTCDAHLHADCIGENCPNCGETWPPEEFEWETK